MLPTQRRYSTAKPRLAAITLRDTSRDGISSEPCRIRAAGHGNLRVVCRAQIVRSCDAAVASARDSLGLLRRPRPGLPGIVLRAVSSDDRHLRRGVRPMYAWAVSGRSCGYPADLVRRLDAACREEPLLGLADHERLGFTGAVRVDPAGRAFARRGARHRDHNRHGKPGLALVQGARAGHFDRLAPGAGALADHERLPVTGTVAVEPDGRAAARRGARHGAGLGVPALVQGARAGHLDRLAPDASRDDGPSGGRRNLRWCRTGHRQWRGTPYRRRTLQDH